MRVKKSVFLVLLCLVSFISQVSASTNTGFVSCSLTDGDVLYVRNGVGGGIVTSLACGTSLEVLNDNAGTTVGCNKWYQVKYNSNDTGYSCGDYITLDNNTNVTTNNKGYVSCVENDDPLTVKSSVNGTIVDRLSCDTEMTIVDKSIGSNGNCSNWYQVSYDNDSKNGYVCGNYVYQKSETDLTDEEKQNYKLYLRDLGFPDSYLDYLVTIHEVHPNWQFRVYKTNLDWNTVIQAESVLGRNLIYYTYGDGYRSTASGSYDWSTNTYYRHSTETSWWYASNDAISYYMDPRNFLTEKYIFMFEALSYQSSFQTSNLVKKILDSSFMPSLYAKYSTDNYSVAFMNAASSYNISPIHLASRILQEVGVNGSVSSRGEFTYNSTTYYNIFNFYNIKATGANPAINGLIWAMGGLDGSGTSYGRPWNTPYKSVLGGAQFLSEDYIGIGQDTLYFQKFDVSRSSGRYTHQYMQNVTAPTTEGLKVYQAYAGISGLLNEKLTFIIPVYNNMPSSAVLAPNNGNPNSYLNGITINGKSIANFSYDTTSYSVNLESGVNSVTIGANPISSKARVIGTGSFNLSDKETKLDLLVTSENGNITTYTITLIKEENVEEIKLSTNNALKSLIVEGYDIGFRKDNLTYSLVVENSVKEVNINYELDDSNATGSGNNKVSLEVGDNKIEIIVTAEDKTTKTYVINITRKDMSINDLLDGSSLKYNSDYLSGISIGTNSSAIINKLKSINEYSTTVIKDSSNNIKNDKLLATGDKITISSNNEEKSYTLLIYGDINGDSNIDKMDALATLRQYYGYVSYEGVYKKAADVNKDGVIDKMDALAILRDYYGYAKIGQ